MSNSDWSSDVCSSDLAVQALVAHRPAHDLAHALHLVEAREVHQHRKAGEELKPLGKAAEHCERLCDILVRINAEGGEIIVLVLHLLVLKEHAVFALGHADGDRKSVVSGKSVSVRVDLGGRRIIKKKKKDTK